MGDVKFTKTHEWVKVEGDVATCGITDYAQKELGDVVFIELPQKGSKVTQFQQMATVESTKAASEVYAPLSGEVVEVNEELTNNPQWINEDPYGKGWIIKVKLSNLAELDNLLSEDEYRDIVAKEKT